MDGVFGELDWNVYGIEWAVYGWKGHIGNENYSGRKVLEARQTACISELVDFFYRSILLV
jgi:hypothetical protein